MAASATKTLGILGGMGPLSTLAFYEHIIRETKAIHDQDHIPVVIDANPSIPDRTEFLLGQGEDPRPMLFDAARRLRAAGAELIAMPCNTASLFTEEIETACGVPFVHWVHTTVAAVEAAELAPIGLLATSGSMRGRLYQAPLEQRSISYLIPDDDEQQEVMEAIYGEWGVKSMSSATPHATQRVLRVAERLRLRGARSLLLGCTELPLLIPGDDDRWPVPALDPALYVARRAVRLAGARLASDR